MALKKGNRTSQNDWRVSKKVLSAIWSCSSSWSALVPYAKCLKHAVTLTRGWIPSRPAALALCSKQGWFKQALYTLSNMGLETRYRLLNNASGYIGFATKYASINVLNALSKSRLMILLPFFEPPGRLMRSMHLWISSVSICDRKSSIVCCMRFQLGVLCTLMTKSWISRVAMDEHVSIEQERDRFCWCMAFAKSPNCMLVFTWFKNARS